MYFDDIYNNNFMFRVAVRDELIKKGYNATDSCNLIRKDMTFIFESFNNMEDPKQVAECLI